MRQALRQPDTSRATIGVGETAVEHYEQTKHAYDIVANAPSIIRGSSSHFSHSPAGSLTMKLVVEGLKSGSDIEQVFQGTCARGHVTTFTVEDLEEAWFSVAQLECARCRRSIKKIDPDEVFVECLFCTSSDTIPISECGVATHACLGGAAIEWEAAGTEKYFELVFGDPLGRNVDPTLKPRADYWEVVVHYTNAKAFIEILRSGKLEAYPTGFFGARRRPRDLKDLSRSVCMTEAPLDATEAFQEFGAFGFAFEKTSLRKLRAAPTLNIPESSLRVIAKAAGTDLSGEFVGGFHRSLLPFVNTIGKNFSFLAEREWRVPKEIPLASFRPWLVLPDDFLLKLRGAGATHQELFRWIKRCGRLRLVDDDHPLW